MFDYLNQHPTSAEILAAVYKIEVTTSKRRAKKMSRALMEAGFQKMREVAPLAEGQLDDQFRSSMAIAEELMKKMKIVN